MRLKAFLAAGLLLILWWGNEALLFHPHVLADISPLHHELPAKAWFYGALSAGELAWIYPHNGLGFSLLGDLTTGIVYLPNVLYFFTPGVSAKLLFLLQFFLLGFGLFHWIGRLSDERRSLSLTLGLMSLGLIWSLPIHLALASVSFVPWFVTSLEDFFREQSLSKATCVGAFAGLIFVNGDPFLILLALALSLPTITNRTKFNLRAIALSALIFILITGANLYELLRLLPESARGQGLADWEVLSYSTNPRRLFEFLFPWAGIESELGRGAQRQWWFERVGGGVVLAAFLARGVWAARRRPSLRSNVIVSSFFLLLSFGHFTPASEWLFVNLLSSIRFPERFLVYSFLAAVPVIVAGMQEILQQKMSQRTLVIVTLAMFSENNFPRPVATTAPARELGSWENSRLGKTLVDGHLRPTRILACHDGINGDSPTGRYFDFRFFGVAMVNGELNLPTPAQKALICPWATSAIARQWLGVNALVTTPTTHREKTHLLEQGWALFETGPTEELWRANDASPETAIWLDAWTSGETVFPPTEALFAGTYKVGQQLPSARPNCSGNIHIDSDFFQQSFTLSIPPDCRGVLSIPWSFHPDTSAWFDGDSKPTATLKINGLTTGVVIDREVRSLRFESKNVLKDGLFLLSISAQLCLILFWGVKKFLPIRKVKAAKFGYHCGEVSKQGSL